MVPVMSFWAYFPIILMFLLFFLKIPVAFSMIISAAVYYLLSPGSLNVVLLCQRLITANSSFVYLAIPFFTCAAVIFNYAGITRRLMDFADSLVGHMVGGLGHVNIVQSTLMGGLSGSANADAAMDSKMLVPQMERLGYDKSYACAVTAASSCITPIIPPGIVLILYSSASDVSVAKMFYSGYIPGLMLMVAMMIVNQIMSVRRNYKPSHVKRCGFREIFKKFLDAVWALLVPFGIIMGLRFGMFTPTEGGAICVVYAIIVGAFIYKELKPKHILPIIIESLTATAGVMFILAGASAFSAYLTWENIPTMISKAMIANIQSPFLFLLSVNALLLMIGCFFDGGAAMILLAPLLVPIAASMGIDLVHFGVVMCINIVIAGITPPFGSQMFTTCSIVNCPIDAYTKQIWPYIIAMLIVLLLLTYIPQIALFLPNLLS